MNLADQTHLRALREQTTSVLRSVVGENRDVALLDAPNQRNVGDSLIWAGELAYFHRLGLNLKYVADLHTYDPAALRAEMPAGVVLLHGGGNLGDLWLGHQNFRERVAKELTDYPIIQLPQSIHFRDRDRAIAANRILSGHPHFRVLLRETLSIDKAGDLLPDIAVDYCPDMALGWDAPDVLRSESDDILVIARKDVEAASGLATNSPRTLNDAQVNVTDWEVGGDHLHSWKQARRVTRLGARYVQLRRKGIRVLPSTIPTRSMHRALERINFANVESASQLYSAHAGVVTDRLHAHVLAALMGRPHIVLDNSYRKVSTIYEEYTGSFSTAHYATSPAEAWNIYTSLTES